MFETPAGKACLGETPQAQAEEAPRPPAESECLEWKSKFYTASKKTVDKRISIFKTKLIGAGVRDSCGESVSKGDPTGVKSAVEAPGTPAESECLKWKSKFYTASEKLWTKGFLSFKTKLIGAGVRDSCGKSVSRGDRAGASRGGSPTARGKRVPEVEINVEL